MIRKTLIGFSVLFALALAGCKDNDSSSRPTPRATCPVWSALYSRTLDCIGDSFDFPTDKSGAHYIVRKAPEVKQGMTVTFRFAFEGSGTFGVSDPSDQPPAHVRLYLQRRGDQLTAQEEHKRFWSAPVVLAVGEHSMIVRLDPGLWTSVFGKRGSDVPGEFQATLSSLEHIGFTFGGMFAGHGAYIIGGPMKMHIMEFKVE